MKTEKISKKLEANAYEPITQAEKRYQMNAQAILFNYFSALKSQPIYVTTENVSDAIELLKLSAELGGFPLLDVVYADQEALPLESRKELGMLVTLLRVLVRENSS